MNTLKLILLGESNTGKTSIISQYLKQTFIKEYSPTISSEIIQKEIEIENKKLIIELYDSPGNKKFRDNIKIFIKNINIALLVYDITNNTSFNELNYWYNQINELNGKNNTFLVVIANKNDLFLKRKVQNDNGKQYAKSINAFFYAINSQNYNNIFETFNKIISEYLSSHNQFEEKEIDENIFKLINNNRFLLSKTILVKKNIKNGINEINETLNKKEINEEIKNEEIKTIQFLNGDLYKGYCKSGLRNGKGIMKYNNGDEYEGNWEIDKINGEGKMKYNNGDEYIGNWKNNIKEGKGKIIYKNGEEYEGTWLKDQFIMEK